MSLARIHKETLVESVIAQLRATVESGEWRVDERIPVESLLAERLGVSRNTVREAVRVLVHAGLLDTRQGAGTFVRAAIDPAETLRRIGRAGLLERVEVRLTLEVEAARLASLRHTDQDRAAMRAALDHRLAHRATEPANQKDLLESFIEIDARFHGAVVEAAHNSALTDLYRYFASATIDTIRQTEIDQALPVPSHADHEALYNAIVAQDPDAAALATRQLLAGTIAALSKVNNDGADRL
ncbi:MAG: FadR/GntR family transcriptional regulator [Salinisphaera sp.]|nr:FadR/GntR family transcriptional regulator [Salinisphaera sp.]